MALGGWDTHVSEGAATGQLAGHLKPLAEGLASLAKALGPELPGHRHPGDLGIRPHDA